MPSEMSRVVAEGMKKLCFDLDDRLNPLGYKRPRGRRWSRQRAEIVENIYLFRLGSTYGAPINYSIDIRVEAFVRDQSNPEERLGLLHNDASIRKSDGFCYHHRFNAKSWSTYERCLDELELYVVDVAGPWFEQFRDK